MPKETPETVNVDQEEMDKKEKENQERTNKRRKDKRLKSQLNNKLQLLSKLKSKKLPLLKEKVEEEVAEKVNNDLFKLNHFNPLITTNLKSSISNFEFKKIITIEVIFNSNEPLKLTKECLRLQRCSEDP